MKNLIYEKISDNRAREFQLKTSIVEEDGKRYVYKEALHEEGVAHVKSMLTHYDLYSKQFEGTIFQIAPVEEIEKGVKYEYVEGKSMSDILDSCLENKDIQAFFRVIEEYKEELEKFESKVCNNLDLVFSNIIVSDVWQVIDTEWTVETPVQVDYLFYRAIKYYMIESSYGRYLESYHLQERYGLTEQQCKTYLDKDQSFQASIKGEVYCKSEEIKPRQNGIKCIIRKLGYKKNTLLWNVEYPNNNLNDNCGMVVFEGWAFCCKDPVTKVEIEIDNDMYQAEYGKVRDDIERAFKGYGSTARLSGFYYEYIYDGTPFKSVVVKIYQKSGRQIEKKLL